MTQIHTLVDTLLGHGILPEELLQRKIDPVVINEVIQQRAARQGLASPKALPPPFPSIPIALSTVSANPQTQSYSPQQPWSAAPFAQPTAFIPPVSPVASVSPSDAMEVASRVQHFLQTQPTPTQPHPPAPVSPTSDDIARKQLEMILLIASKVLPQGWDSLVKPHQIDNLTSAPSALGPSSASNSPSQLVKDSSNTPLVIPLRHDTDRDQNKRDAPRAASTSGVRTWSLFTEERDTTKKFGDLTISGVAPPPLPIRPVGPPATRPHTAVTDNTTPSINGQPDPSDKAIIPPPPPPPPPSLPLAPPPPPPPPSSPPKEECLPTGSVADQPTPETKAGAESTGTDMKVHTVQPTDVSYMESIPAGPDGPSSGSQDEMDMDLDDGYGGSMILNGSWRTMEERSGNGPNFSTQHPPHRSTQLYNLQYGTSSRSHIHSAPASIINTPVRSPAQTELQSGSTIHRGNPRRATALDFISKLPQPTPFIMERQLPYLIDLDDEDGDEIGGYPAAENFSASKSRMISTSDRSEFLNQEMKRLNERIAARERAKLSLPSTPVTHNSSPQSPAQGAPSPMSQQPDPTSRKPSPQQDDQDMTSGSSSTPLTDEADLLKETLSNHTKTLEQLRLQLQQAEQEKRSASTSLGAEAIKSENDRQDLQEVHQTLQAARECVALKAKELEEAQRHLRQAEGALAPLLNRLDASTAAKAVLQERLNRAESSCIELKGSIASIQQDIIRKRTRIMMLGSSSATKSTSKPSDVKAQSKHENPEEQRPIEETTQDAVADQEMTLSEDTGKLSS